MRQMTKALLGAVSLPFAVAVSSSTTARAVCRPCQPKALTPGGPRAAANSKTQSNPCAARSPRGAEKMARPCSPCAASDLPVPKPSEVTRPAGSKRFTGDRTHMLQLGEKLYKDTSLSTNEMACSSCHSDFMAFNDSFRRPYPHVVGMPKDVSGIAPISAEGMVQFCLIRPMMGKPLSWDSEQLAALTTYVEKLQNDYAKR